MPGRYGAKGIKRRVVRGRPFKRRRYAKKGKKAFQRGSPRSVTVRATNGLPDRFRVKLRAIGQVSYTQAPGTFGNASFVGNNGEDINTGGGGGSAAYWTQYAGLYENYVITGSSINVASVLNNATNGPANTMTYITPSPDTAGFSTLEQVEENRWTKRQNMKVYSIGIGSGNQRYYMSTAKALGVPKRAIIDDFTYHGTTAGSPPSAQWHWHLSNYVQGGSVTQSLVQEVRITYYVTFFTPKRQS